MRKTNFLKGLGAKLALAVVAFGAVLASCTEEDFNVEYKANNAQIYFNPIVIDAMTNTIVLGATLTGNEPIVGTPDIAAGSTTITATVNDVSGSATVAYAAVPAGSVVTYSAVILLSPKFTAEKISEVVVGSEKIIGQGEQGHSHDGLNWNYNASDYFAKFVPTWNFVRTNKVVDTEIYIPSKKLNDYIDAFNNVDVTVQGVKEYMISAWGMYRADLTITNKNVTYNLTSKVSGDVVAKIVVNEPIAEATCDLVEKAIPGHAGHYHAGHGHGESTNAGGGIVWGE